MRRARWSALPGLVVALAPKCPLCLAGYLSTAGLGAATATRVAPWLRPIAEVMLLWVLLITAWTLLARLVRR